MKAYRLSIHFLLIVLWSVSFKSFAQKPIVLQSPNQKITFSFRLNPAAPTYAVSLNDQMLINESELSLTFREKGFWGKNLHLRKKTFRTVQDSYELVIGKTKFVNETYQELVLQLQEQSKPKRQINLVVRAYNDAIAFRYEFPKQKNWTTYTLTNENTTFNLANDPKAHLLLRENFTTSHEGEYSSLDLSKITPDTLIDLPALFEYQNDAYLAITEAALVDYAGMYLKKQAGIIRSQLSPLPSDTTAYVKANLPHRTPWRVLMIGERVGALIESNILTNLNEPCKITDVSWIKPGKTTFPWWNGSIVMDSSFKQGNNFETAKHYIDFCAANGIEYHSVVEHDGHEWYTNEGSGYMPGPNADVMKPVEGCDMQKICDYAHSKGVGIRVWTYWSALNKKLDSAFALYQKWGINGLMIDFMDRDDQEMVNTMENMLKKAAQHQLHVQFHGAPKPTGLIRTYPNEFTREGVMNLEYDKWSNRITPDHNLMIPFTRLLAGPTDYHLCGFRGVSVDSFKIQNRQPLTMGSRCHALAMYVVYESPLQMVADYPEAYINQPGFEFIKAIPTVWEETRVLDAKVGQYISMARRKGNEWFVGTMTNNSSRSLDIKFDFLGEGEYIAEIYGDDLKDTHFLNGIVSQTISIKKGHRLVAQLGKGGGHVIRVRKKG